MQLRTNMTVSGAPIVALDVMEPAPDQVIERKQQEPCACIGGHFTEPNEQNTQQSPGLGRSRAPHPVHS
jgi:hypothetical protein